MSSLSLSRSKMSRLQSPGMTTTMMMKNPGSGFHPTVKPIVHDDDRYQYIKDIGAGNFGVARLMKDNYRNELVAVKYIERGDKIDENVQREIINHRTLNHPNIIGFKEVVLTPTHLAIVMEYASGGELFERMQTAGRLGEDEARFFFQQLISGVSYCHDMQICHRDLKLENALLDGNPVPCLKICDFGYSKSSLFHSEPKSTVGTPAYIAPEVIINPEYDGKVADVWSCGVTLFVMLYGAYPFEDPEKPSDSHRMIQRILKVNYTMPETIYLSPQCRDLLIRIFVKDPKARIKVSEIKKHPWYLKNLPEELRIENEKGGYIEEQQRHYQKNTQSVEEITQIVSEATIPPRTNTFNRFINNFVDLDMMDADDFNDDDIFDSELDFDSSGEIVCI